MTTPHTCGTIKFSDPFSFPLLLVNGRSLSFTIKPHTVKPQTGNVAVNLIQSNSEQKLKKKFQFSGASDMQPRKEKIKTYMENGLFCGMPHNEIPLRFLEFFFSSSSLP